MNPFTQGACVQFLKGNIVRRCGKILTNMCDKCEKCKTKAYTECIGDVRDRLYCLVVYPDNHKYKYYYNELKLDYMTMYDYDYDGSEQVSTATISSILNCSSNTSENQNTTEISENNKNDTFLANNRILSLINFCDIDVRQLAITNIDIETPDNLDPEPEVEPNFTIEDPFSTDLVSVISDNHFALSELKKSQYIYNREGENNILDDDAFDESSSTEEDLMRRLEEAWTHQV